MIEINKIYIHETGDGCGSKLYLNLVLLDPDIIIAVVHMYAVCG